ncbi:MAG: choice-of-anchor L domain-containing protein [Colwellia sp.]|nr:choice-of-anchor L domain-containing protein [Colwellia sp.]
MKFKYSKTVFAGLILSISSFANAGLMVTQNDTAGDLVSNILGGGITSSNISNSGAANAFGTFTGGLSAGIGIDSGIMLSTGNVNDAIGPNSTGDTQTNFGTPGDANLTALSGDPTFDAAFLTFDFISDGGNVFFNYVFASEEYNEFVNSNVNDVFAFFLDGVNVALIPGTNTPVSIDTVNLGINSGLFNDNDGGSFDIEYDGFTDVFTASVLGLSAGTHTISMGIADGGDGVWDSTVFIQASSFTDNVTVTVPEPSTLAIFALGIMGLASRRFKKQ